MAKRGREILLDNLSPSEAMIKKLEEKYPNQQNRPQAKSVREWIFAMGITQEMEKLWSALSQAQKEQDTEKEKTIRKQIAKKQEEYTNLFLETTMKSLPGGYQGWNE